MLRKELYDKITALERLKDIWDSGWDDIGVDTAIYSPFLSLSRIFWGSVLEGALRENKSVGEKLRRQIEEVPPHMYELPEEKKFWPEWLSYWKNRLLDWAELKGVVNITMKMLSTVRPFSELCSDEERRVILRYLVRENLAEWVDDKIAGITLAISDESLADSVIRWGRKNKTFVFSSQDLKEDSEFEGFPLQRLERVVSFMVKHRLARWASKKEKTICILASQGT